MDPQILILKSLRSRLEELKARNPNFSLRSMARMLEVSPASLSEFLNGKRALSIKMLKKIATKLHLPPAQYRLFKESVEAARHGDRYEGTGIQQELKRKVQLENDQYFLVADWHYYAILCLLETEDFKSDFAWMAKKLDTSINRVEECMQGLLRLGYVIRDLDGQYRCREIELATTEDIQDSSLQRRYLENMEAAKDSLYQDEINKRDFSFMTMAVDPRDLPLIKNKIRNFQDELEAFCSRRKKEEVYEFCFNIFPRSKDL